jgi:thiol-disulfide isomerase/thioredoxin
MNDKLMPGLGRLTRFLLPSLLGTLLLAQAAAAPAEKGTASSPEAEKAWEDVMQSSQPPRRPESWNTARPSQEEIDKFKAAEAERLAKAAEKAKSFQTRFPKDSHTGEASAMEYQLLQTSAQLGNTNVFARLEQIEDAKLKDPQTSENDRFEIRASAVNRKAMSKMSEGEAAALAEFEKGARALLKEFPNRAEIYQMLLSVASEAEPEKGRQIAKELTESSAPDQIKEAAQGILKKMERVGKPVPIKFTAVDGRAVDLAKLKGKVVLIDFWATWCGPCVGEVPNVVAAYEKLHPKGFEIVGISFDSDKQKLTSFVEKQKMTWPQYFDGKQWENAYGKEFGIQSIPSMWLVDRKGNLRDLNAREDLKGKVEKLLAEAP